MDQQGNMAIGYSASSSTINPQIRYAGRLAGDPINTLPQAEVTMFAGTGSQVGTSSRWGDYSDMTIDPVDDCTFWYTQEYYATTAQFRLAHAHRFVQVSGLRRRAHADTNADACPVTNTDADSNPDSGANPSTLRAI